MDAAAKLAALIPPELAGVVRLGRVSEPGKQIRLPLALEELLGSGLPRGRICEVVGRRGSGRTSLIYAFLAAATTSSEMAAVVDAGDAFDPPGAARAGIGLASLLWVRPPSARDAVRCAEMILDAGGFGLVVLDLDGPPLRRLRDYAWPRLARAAEKAGAALVILAPHRLSGSFAAVGVEMTARPRFDRPHPLAPSLLVSLDTYATLVHNKRGPLRAPHPLRWTAAAQDDQLKTQNSKLKTHSAPSAREAR